MAQQLPKSTRFTPASADRAHGSAAAPSLLARALGFSPSSRCSSPTVSWSAGRRCRGRRTTSAASWGVPWAWSPWWPWASTTGAFEPHHGAARHQRGAHPSAPHRASAPTRGIGGQVRSRSACRCSPASSRRSRWALRRESSGPLPGHAGRLARVLQGARDAARSVRGHHDPRTLVHGGWCYGHLRGGARHGEAPGGATCSSRSSPASRPSRRCSPSTSC